MGWTPIPLANYTEPCLTSKTMPSRRSARTPQPAKLTRSSLIQVAILNGANGTFCAGFDLTTVKPDGLGGELHYDTKNVSRTIGPMGPSRLQIKKPVISAVSGHAVAGGLELSLLGDMRVVEEDAVFGVFCRRWGVRVSLSSSKIVLMNIRYLSSTAAPYGYKQSLGLAMLWT